MNKTLNLRIGFLLLLSTLMHSIFGSDSFYYKEEMRKFVAEISTYSRSLKPGFIVIPQNGIEIITRTGETTDIVQTEFAKSIDGWGIEDLFYGAVDDNVPTKPTDTNYVIKYIDIAKNLGKTILVTDYCWTKSYIDASYQKNFQKGYISFAADERELNNIPSFPTKPFNENSNNILTLNMAKNFLYLLNAEKYATKQDFFNAVKKTNYDVIIIDAFFNEKTFTKAEIQSLKLKANNAKRLVIAYMSIGEAENYKYYWGSTWRVGNPSFLNAENPDWQGNYKVKYWDTNWKKIIYGNDNSYSKKIIDMDFDGVYLDIIDGFQFFESA